jgi:hypothetical protein
MKECQCAPFWTKGDVFFYQALRLKKGHSSTSWHTHAMLDTQRLDFLYNFGLNVRRRIFRRGTHVLARYVGSGKNDDS